MQQLLLQRTPQHFPVRNRKEKKTPPTDGTVISLQPCLVHKVRSLMTLLKLIAEITPPAYNYYDYYEVKIVD